MPAMLANVITPLMFLGCWQLLIGNAIIGIVEAKVIGRFLGPGRRASIWIMIGANYFSWIVGGFLMLGLAEGLQSMLLGDVPLYHVHRLLIATVLLCLALSILLEWPFVHAAIRGECSAGRSLAASAVAQGASYLILLIPWWLASNVLDGIAIAPVAEVSRNKDAAVLFIGNDGDMYRAALDGTPPRKHRALGCGDPDAALGVEFDESGRLGLYLHQGEDQKLIDDSPELMAQLAGYFNNPARSRLAASLCPPDARSWTVAVADPRYYGLDAWKGSPLGERVHVAVSTPVFRWPSRSATILPGDQVVFELNNHILLVDLPTRRASVVAIGRGPVVLVPPPPTPPATLPTTSPSKPDR